MSFDVHRPNGDEFMPKLGSAAEMPDDLPDDLAALGEQLAADAAHLAALYPASSYPAEFVGAREQLETRRIATKWRIGLRWVAAASVLVAVSAWSFATREASVPQPQTPAADATHAADIAQAANADAAASPASIAPVGKNAVAAPPRGVRSAAVPSGVFQTLTGAEQEALLDLMEAENVEQFSLSI